MTTEGTQPKTPNNFAGLRFVEPLIRQFLSYQLGEIAKYVDDPDVTFLEELFNGFDRFMPDGVDIIKDIKTWFRDHPNIQTSINFPRHDISLPFVSVVNGAEQEQAGAQYLGDHGGEAEYGVLGGSGPTHVREVLSIPQAHQTNVYVATSDPNTALYLYTVVRALLLVNKLDFDQQGGMRNLVINGADIEFRPDLFPEFAYFKVLSLNYDTDFDLPLQAHASIGGLDLSLKAATHNFTTVTVVPEDC